MYSWRGQFTVKLQDGGALTQSLDATTYIRQKIPELTFEDFGADERIFPQAGKLSAGQFASLRCGAVALFKSSSPQDQTKSPEPKFGAFRLVRMKGFEPTLF